MGSHCIWQLSALKAKKVLEGTTVDSGTLRTTRSVVIFAVRVTKLCDGGHRAIVMKKHGDNFPLNLTCTRTPLAQGKSCFSFGFVREMLNRLHNFLF
jgi:hypothetical protein